MPLVIALVLLYPRNISIAENQLGISQWEAYMIKVDR